MNDEVGQELTLVPSQAGQEMILLGKNVEETFDYDAILVRIQCVYNNSARAGEHQ